VPDDSEPLRTSIIIALLIILTIINALVAQAEMAFVSVRRNKLLEPSLENDKRTKILNKLLSKPTKFLSTIQVIFTVTGFLVSSLAGISFSNYIVTLFKKINITIPNELASIIVIFILSFFFLIFGEFIPKRVALKNPEKIALSRVRFISWIMAISWPFVKVITATSNAILRLFGYSKQTFDEKVSEDEIRSMIVTGHIEGVIDEEEKEMFDSIFKFDDTEAETIMTPRPNVFAIDIDDNFTDRIEDIINSGYSRIPVYKGDKDNIIGVLYVKDLLKEAHKVGFDKVELAKIIRKPYFVPSHIKINVLFKNMKETNNHIAIIIDEYGGSLGIITMEDLIEEIMGNIYDEYDIVEQSIKKLDDNHYIINGSMPIHDLNRILKLDIDEEHEEFDTLGGLIISKLGYIPKVTGQEEVHYNNLLLKVNKITNNRIDEVLLEILPSNEISSPEII